MATDIRQPEDPSKTALKKALDLLSRREHSRHELRNKLLLRDFTAEIIEVVLTKLVEHQWQSDQRFAESYVHARKQRMFGPIRLRQELSERGVSDDIINGLLSENDDDWIGLANSLRIKRFGDVMPADFKERAKQMRFLQYRGFTTEQIKHIL